MVGSTTNRISYNVTSASTAPLAVDYRFDDSSWLQVRYVETGAETSQLLTIGTHYTVGGDGTAIEGTVTLTSGFLDTITAGELVIARFTPAVQEVNLEYNTRFPAVAVEQQMDETVMALQDRTDSDFQAGSRAIYLPPTEPTSNTNTLPIPSFRAGKFFAFNSETGAIEALSTEDAAIRILAYYGLDITSEDVLATISAIAPIERFTPPTTSTEALFGQFAIMPEHVDLEITGTLTPDITGTLMPWKTQNGKPWFSTYGEDPTTLTGDAISVLISWTGVWTISVYEYGVVNVDERWVSFPGPWLDDPYPDAVGTWINTGTTGQPDIEAINFSAARAWINLAPTGTTPNWREITTSVEGILIPTGIVGDDSTINTDALQAAFDTALSTGAVVFIPPGIYLSGNLTKDPSVRVTSANRRTTVIKATESGPLISSVGTTPLTVPNLPIVGQAEISEITLDGNSGTGTVGLFISETQFWSVDGVIAQGFSDAGFDFSGAVGGYCNDCRAFSNGTGFRFDEAFPSTVFGPGNHLPSNLTGMNQCVAILNNFRGVEYTNGCNFAMRDCEIESNGSAGNANSGGIYVKAVHHTPGSHGLIMSGGWNEDSRGGFGIKIDEADGATLHSITDVFFYNYTDNLDHMIVVDGTKPNNLVVDRCRVDNNSIKKDIYVTGTNDRALIEQKSSNSFIVLNSARGAIKTPVFPLAWWRMNEGTGTTTLDAALEELDGSLLNTTWVTGRRTGTSALSFNGTSSNLQSPLSHLLKVPDKRMSISVWVKKSSAPGAASVTISTGTAELVYVSALVINTGGTAQFSLYNGTLNPEAVGSVDVCDNAWHHICGTYDGKVSRLYVDGVLDTEIEASLDILAVSAPKVICGMTVNSTLKFAGTLEDGRIYNMCLSPSQVLDLYYQ